MQPKQWLMERLHSKQTPKKLRMKKGLARVTGAILLDFGITASDSIPTLHGPSRQWVHMMQLLKNNEQLFKA